VLEIEIGNTTSHSVENWFWKRLRTRLNSDCVVTLSVKRRKVTLAYRGNESVVHMYVSKSGRTCWFTRRLLHQKVKLFFVQPETNSHSRLCVHCVRNNCSLRKEYQNIFRIYVSETRKETS